MSAEANYTAGLLIIGNEILSGRTQDANTSYLAQRLNKKGIQLVETRTVRDIEDEIIKALNDLRSSYRYIFTTGGIGPTHDDITTEAIAKAFGVPVLEHPEARKCLENHYKTRDLNLPRLKMALIPEGAELIYNSNSGAPGFRLGNVHVMAGVPEIMQNMLNNIIDELEGGAPVISNTVPCPNCKESMVALQLEEIQNQYPEIDIGSYPYFKNKEYGINLVLKGTNHNLLDEATSEVTNIVREVIGK